VEAARLVDDDDDVVRRAWWIALEVRAGVNPDAREEDLRARRARSWECIMLIDMDN